MATRRDVGDSIMARRSQGTLLSVIFAIFGITSLCAAAPYAVRQRCPNCPRDCPENLAGVPVLPTNDLYSAIAKPQYSPAALAPIYAPQPVAYPSVAGPPVVPAYAPPPPPPVSYGPPVPLHAPPVPYKAPIKYTPPVRHPSYDKPPSSSYYDKSAPSPLPASYKAEDESRNYDKPASSYSTPAPPSYKAENEESANYNKPASSFSPAQSPPSPPVPPTPYYDRSKQSSSNNGLPVPSRYNAPTKYNPWTQPPPYFRNFNYNPYTAPEYQPKFYTGSSGSSPCGSSPCGCGSKYSEELMDDEDEYEYNKYTRRSLGSEPSLAPVFNGQYNYQDPFNSPADMYKTYRPWNRGSSRRDVSDDDSNEESKRDRERLYVVYRADAVKNRLPSSELSDYEFDSPVRKAIGTAQDQRAQEAAAMYTTNQLYRYDHAGVSQVSEDQPVFHSLMTQPYWVPKQPQPAYENYQTKQQHDYRQPTMYSDMSPGQLMDREDHFVAREDGDEIADPGWDQSKWTLVPAVPSEFDFAPKKIGNPGNVQDDIKKENEGFADEGVLDLGVDDWKVPEKLAGEDKTEEKKESIIGMLEDMEKPTTVTEPTELKKTSEIIVDGI